MGKDRWIMSASVGQEHVIAERNRPVSTGCQHRASNETSQAASIAIEPHTGAVDHRRKFSQSGRLRGCHSFCWHRFASSSAKAITKTRKHENTKK
jgi:hypothetical protein